MKALNRLEILIRADIHKCAEQLKKNIKAHKETLDTECEVLNELKSDVEAFLMLFRHLAPGVTLTSAFPIKAPSGLQSFVNSLLIYWVPAGLH